MKNKIVRFMNRLVFHKDMISFSSIPDYSDNAQAFFRYLMNNSDIPKNKIVWHINKKEKKQVLSEIIYENSSKNVKIVTKGSIQSLWYFFRSKICISTHGLYNNITIQNKQKQIMLWHGMPLKRIGYMNETDISIGVPLGHFYSVTSDFFRHVFQECFRVKSDDVQIFGQPRTDYFVQSDVNCIKKKLECYSKKVIMFMPTYRKTDVKGGRSDGEYLHDTLFSLSEKDWQEINEILNKKDQILIIKPHPLEKLDHLNYINNSANIILLTDERLLELKLQLYQVLSVADALITDYSSVYIDYMLLNRAIGFFLPDYEKYQNDRGFVIDNPFDYLPGRICITVSELKAFIVDYEKDEFKNKREQLNNQWNQFEVGKSSERIFNYLTKNQII